MRNVVTMAAGCVMLAAMACGGSEQAGPNGDPGTPSVTVSPAQHALVVGDTVRLAATGTFTGTPAWTSSAPGIASVTPAGLVTGIATGSAQITASVGGGSGSASVTVTPDPCLNTTGTLALGDTTPGTLTSQSCVIDQWYYDRWTFSLTTATEVRIRVSSDAFDAYLVLTNAGNQGFGQDDNSGPGTTAEIARTLPAGNYIVWPSTAEEAVTGAYQVALTTREWERIEAGSVGSWFGMDFPDDTVGYLAGSGTAGTLLKTVDGGFTWSVLKSGDDGWQAASFISPDTGWIASYWGSRIEGTTDGGATWTTVLDVSAGSFLIEDLHFANADDGLAAAGSHYFVTTDGGTTWDERTGGTHTYVYGLSSAHIAPGDVWYLGGTARLQGEFASESALHRSLGGTNWSTVRRGGAHIGNIGSRGMHFVSATVGWVVGNNGEIFKTTNAGTGWTRQANGQTLSELDDVSFFHADSGFVVGFRSSIILQTTNGGGTWVSRDLPDQLNQTLRKVSCPSRRACYAAGGGVFYRY